MALEQTTLQVGYTVSVGTSIVLCTILWRHRKNTGAIPLFCWVFTGLLWGANQLANVTISDPAISAALYRLWFLCIPPSTAFLFVFALEYTGRERYLGPKTYLALSIHPLVVLVFVVADPGGLFFGAIEPDPTVPSGVVANHGIAFGLHVIYSYLLVTVTMVLFGEMLYRTRSVYRAQSVALIVGVFLSSTPPLIQVFDLIDFDATALVFPLSSALLTVAIVRYRLVDLVPIARDRVFDSVSDGVLVIDREDRFVDVNPAGRRMLAKMGVTDDPVGRRLPSLLEHEEMERLYETAIETGDETSLEVSIGSSDFHVRGTPITDDNGRHVGWLLIAHDITERKRREEKLERQNERLERFTSLVSHDLRNPLNVADGYLDLARETDDDGRYLDEIERSHERMETIIDDVLALAREGQDVTDPQPVALDALANTAWGGVETGSATVTIDADERILADPDRARRLLENLFRNAVEHGSTNPDSQTRQDAVEHGSTSPDSRTRRDAVEHGAERNEKIDLEIRVGTISDHARGSIVGFYVEDDGSGIPEERRDRVLEDGYTTGEDGTGLGLSIVESIATAHDWSVRIDESADGGARFELTGVTAATDADGGNET